MLLTWIGSETSTASAGKECHVTSAVPIRPCKSSFTQIDAAGTAQVSPRPNATILHGQEWH